MLAQCDIDIVIDGPSVRARWYDLWSNANAVVSICAEQGKDGVYAMRSKRHLLVKKYRNADRDSDGDTELAVWVSNGATAPSISTA